MSLTLEVRQLGLCEYQSTLEAMQTLTATRDNTSTDQLWVLQHPPVFTQGISGKREHVLDPGIIPVIQIDRGGQVTYHGPGQLVIYCLLDLKRKGLGVRDLVTRLEQSVIDLLAAYAIEAHSRCAAPGVYVGEEKLASLGLRIRHGCSYHGLSVNVDMDLEPFQRINPCGYAGLQMTQLRDLGIDSGMDTVSGQLVRHLATNLGYTING